MGIHSNSSGDTLLRSTEKEKSCTTWEEEQMLQLDKELNLPPVLAQYPRASLLFPAASPVQRLTRISADITEQLGREVRIWVKREDCNSPPFSFGGNKTRKLEYIIPDVLAGGYDTLVTCGGRQSNCMRQVAAAGALYGLGVKLVEEKDSANWTPRAHNLRSPLRPRGNIQVSQLMCGMGCYTADSVEETLTNLVSKGKKPYFIPVGASRHPLGGLGYARCAFEIINQESRLGSSFDNLVVTTLSGSTVGGLLVGFKLAELTGLCSRQRRIACVYVGSEGESVIRNDILRSCELTAEKLSISSDDMGDIIEGKDAVLSWQIICHLSKYGDLPGATADVMRYAARKEAMILDPVYTAKGFEMLLNRCVSENANNFLFVHTGGQQVLSTYDFGDFS